jgi:hypothetical protein
MTALTANSSLFVQADGSVFLLVIVILIIVAVIFR